MSMTVTKEQSARNIIELLEFGDESSETDSMGCVLDNNMLSLGVVGKEFVDEIVQEVLSKFEPEEVAFNLNQDSDCFGVPCRYVRSRTNPNVFSIWMKIEFYKKFSQVLRDKYLEKSA